MRITTRSSCLVAYVILLPVLAPSADGRRRDVPADVSFLESGDLPVYPPLARAGLIMGFVRVRVTTGGDRVQTVEHLGSAPAVLKEAAETTLRTWRFQRHEATSFDVTFDFGARAGVDCDRNANAEYVLRLPRSIRILAMPVVYCDVNFGSASAAANQVGPVEPQRLPALPPVVVSGGAMPLYPASARKRGASGDVRLRVQNGGRAIEARSGPTDLADAAVATARTWRFDQWREDSIDVVFRYRLLPKDCTGDDGAETSEIKFPHVVEVAVQDRRGCGSGESSDRTLLPVR